MRAHALVIVLVVGAGSAGCGEKGTITFQIDAPTGMNSALSPFNDRRAESASLVDETSGRTLGVPILTSEMADPKTGGIDIGDLAIGHFDLLRLNVNGGGQLLGLARTRNIDVLPLQPVTVTLHARKPIAAFGALSTFTPTSLYPAPDPLMLLDTTLPAIPTLPPPSKVKESMLATASTSDGLLMLVGGASSNISALDTGTLYSAGPVSAELVPATDATTKPVPRQIIVSPDDKCAAVISSQGFSVFSPQNLADGKITTIATERATGAIAAAWAADGRTLTVLVGTPWNKLDCNNPPGAPASYFVYDVNDCGKPELRSGPNSLATPTGAPVAATDLAFDRTGALVFAVPCGTSAGILRFDGKMALQAPGIYDVVAFGDKLVGVENVIDTSGLPAEGDTTGQQGTIVVMEGPTKRNVPFPVLASRISMKFRDSLDTDVPVEVLLEPTPDGVTAYRAATSPDGSHLVFFYRTRYRMVNEVFYRDKVEIRLPAPFNDLSVYSIRCSLDVQRDAYRVAEVELSTGAVGYNATRGINDSVACQITCQTCAITSGGECQTSTGSCNTSVGYVPGGLSIMAGYR